MKKMRVNEIFYSIQGEGQHTGKAAVFVRFAICNLRCPFCDTDFHTYTEMTEYEIVDKVCELNQTCRYVVLTGGEPTLYDCTQLIDLLHKNGYRVAMESNGTHTPPWNVDWLTISPKVDHTKNGEVKVKVCDELKVIFDLDHEPQTYGIGAKEFYLQPCDTGNPEKNAEILTALVEYVKKNPQWKISLQTQKMLNVR